MFGPADWGVFIGYFAVTLAVGFWSGRRERNTTDFFLGGRRQHWLLAGMSIIATEVSALTLIGVPAEAYAADWSYLQLYAGAFLGRWLIVFLLLPAFYGGSVTTVYEYLGQRFGRRTQTTAALCFMFSKIVGGSIRVLASAIAVSETFDWSLPWVIGGMMVVVTAYTTHGGIKAILWTDLLQALTFIGGGGAALVFLFLLVPGAWHENVAAAWHSGKMHTFTWRPAEGVPWDKVFWLLLVSSTLQNMAALGTDQDLTQRMLTCRDVRQSQRSLIFNLFAGFPIVCLFLSVGTMLYLAYSGGHAPGPTPNVSREGVFPFFIANTLPSGVGLRGLLVTAIFAASMSSAASALGALSSSAVTDLYRPFMTLRAPQGHARSEAHYLRVARGLTFAFGAILAAVAFGLRGSQGLLWEALSWAGLVFGAMLGVFLLGVLTKTRGSDRANLWIMFSSAVLLAWFKIGQSVFPTEPARSADGVPSWMLFLFPAWQSAVVWPWWIIIGTVWTFGWGCCFARPAGSGSGAADHPASSRNSSPSR